MIKAHITDAAALAARTPAELSAYLRANGWHLIRRTETVAFWALPVDDGELEIMQPLVLCRLAGTDEVVRPHCEEQIGFRILPETSTD